MLEVSQSNLLSHQFHSVFLKVTHSLCLIPPQKRIGRHKDYIKTFRVIFLQAFDGEMATTLKELPVTYLIPVVINNHFYGNPNDFKEIVLQSSAPEIVEIR